MDALRDLLRTEITGVGGGAVTGGTAFHSTADPEAERLDAAYWVRNLREPVRFWPAVERLVAEGHDTFVEISPHPVVLGAIGRGIEADLLLLPSMRRDEGVEVALGSLAHLYVAGHEPDWPALFPGRGAHVDLPRYPWQHTSFPWKDSATAGRPRHGTAGHPILGARMQLAAHPGTEFWESWQDVRTTPYLAEHRVDDMAVFPAAGYAEMALAASGGEPVELTDLIFAAALTLPDQRTTQVQLALAGTGEQRAFQIYSDQGDGAWTLHAKGRLRPAPATEPATEAAQAPAVPEGCAVIGADDFYRECAARGLRYGPRFQRIQRVHRAGSEAWAELSGFGTVTAPGDPHVVHPAILDACLQTVLATLPDGTDTYLPVSLTRLRLHGAPADGCLAHASLGADGRADLKVWNPDGTLVLEVDGLAMRRLGGTDDATEKMTEARYEIAWQPLPAPPREETTRRLLLLDAPRRHAARDADRPRPHLRQGPPRPDVRASGSRPLRHRPGRPPPTSPACSPTSPPTTTWTASSTPGPCSPATRGGRGSRTAPLPWERPPPRTRRRRTRTCWPGRSPWPVAARCTWCRRWPPHRPGCGSSPREPPPSGRASCPTSCRRPCGDSAGPSPTSTPSCAAPSWTSNRAAPARSPTSWRPRTRTRWPGGTASGTRPGCAACRTPYRRMTRPCAAPSCCAAAAGSGWRCPRRARWTGSASPPRRRSRPRPARSRSGWRSRR
ncbi:polyketide synthase dehydratase domain-containing protein [Nonomuraea salmonea]|uniref:polyketide synthase dehydratase domain-containing protein n=1 Tax=Nonomuraea salmonea TaxID=46181 RepID=UPI0031EE90B7